MSTARRLNEILRMTERQKLLDGLSLAMVEWGLDQGLFRSCLNCTHWTGETPQYGEPPESCRLYRARPPARIIVTGCDEHTDFIPF